MPATTEGWIKRRPPTVEEYIKKKTYKSGSCLLWKNTPKGRTGFFQYNYVTGGAPRRVYEALVGPVPEHLCVLHSCDDRRCVNIKHLRVGTRKENRQDFMERHPRAMELCLEASKVGAKGVKKFWDSMTLKERQEFIIKRSKIQSAKRRERC